jgi:hypothetical protein
LTNIFWLWSGLASLGTFYLILFAPFVMIWIAYQQRKIKMNSKYHNWTYLSALFYFAIAPIAFLVLSSGI